MNGIPSPLPLGLALPQVKGVTITIHRVNGITITIVIRRTSTISIAITTDHVTG